MQQMQSVTGSVKGKLGKPKKRGVQPCGSFVYQRATRLVCRAAPLAGDPTGTFANRGFKRVWNEKSMKLSVLTAALHPFRATWYMHVFGGKQVGTSGEYFFTVPKGLAKITRRQQTLQQA